MNNARRKQLNLVDGRKVDRMIRFARRADDMIAADLS